jgi:uncharacterized membrane protein (UPF0127 family)
MAEQDHSRFPDHNTSTNTCKFMWNFRMETDVLHVVHDAQVTYIKMWEPMHQPSTQTH